MGAKSVNVRFLKRVSLLADLDDAVLKEIASMAGSEQYAPNTDILRENQAGKDTFYMIGKGKVKVCRVNEEGREVILTILSRGDFFGEMSLLDGAARSATVTTVTDAELYTLTGHNFLMLLGTYPGIGLNLIKVLCGRIRRSDAQIKSLTMMNSIGRVAAALLRLISPDGTESLSRRPAHIDALPPLKDLASMAGSSRATVTKALHAFAQSGMLKREGRRATIRNPVQFREFYC